MPSEEDKSNLSRIEEKVIDFWENNHIFEKSVNNRKKKKLFSFYDGPPFATGLPHYGHILATTIKDSVTRFWTMKGYRVERRIGWDCHGLPVENLIEKELGLKDKKAIESFGMENFNNACRAAVFRSVGDFQKTLKRVGRWADYSDSYATLQNTYMESVWWVFKKLWSARLIYSDYRVTPYCPRCGTPLSNFEVNQGYKDTKDPAIFVKFELKNPEDNIPTYFVAWTTTPWTLTANAALAVNPDIDYVYVVKDDANGKERLIFAKDRTEDIIGAESHQIEKTVKGKDLCGKEYKPIFSFIEPDGKAHFVIGAGFVSTEDGSGIVHIAPAFGADDMEAAKNNGIPVILTVDKEGKFVKEVTPWAGKFVKAADPEIIGYLKSAGVLLKEGETEHSYPFCWRCDTPLLYYPIDSWYVAVTKIKDNLVRNNLKIRWVPSHLKEGRFGKWLADARDWAISRDRFWGTPIPVWKCSECEEFIPVGSLEELARLSPLKNSYFILRHGEADSNVLNIVSSHPEKTEINITEKGKKEIERAAKELKKQGIDVIFSSPLKRAADAAEIISKAMDVGYETDDRLTEYDFGLLNGVPAEEFETYVGGHKGKFEKAPEEGETLNDVRRRMVSFFREAEKKYEGKKILIIGHGDPLWVFEGSVSGKDDEELLESRSDLIKTGEWRKLPGGMIPLNGNGQPDLHRPYIDSVEINCPKCGSSARRIPQVFDCWFESGSMPYASWHYPFENKRKVESMFPADFIAEGLDQTRGWFYTLHVLASALTLKNIGLGRNKPAFKNVIVNGLILDEIGRKLSKKLRNYTEPEKVFDKYGADSLRYFLLSSTSIGDDYRFTDRGVAETKAKVLDRFLNCYNFFRMYADKKDVSFGYKNPAREELIDRWIKTRLTQTVREVSENMGKYELTAATRPIMVFLEDLSNWYIRRSRRRFQRPDSAEEFYAASKTLYDCLVDTAKILAPFAPFLSEEIYKSLTEGKGKESVHLEDWPLSRKVTAEEEKMIFNMEKARGLASAALAMRSKEGIKVKQPLSSYRFSVKDLKEKKDILSLVADEANIKEIIYDETAPEEGVLDTEITNELREEGMLREIIRAVQDLRQKAGFNPGENIILYVEGNERLSAIIRRNEREAKKILSLKNWEEKKNDDVIAFAEIKIEGMLFWLGIKKA